jgi:hypothetical protein
MRWQLYMRGPAGSRGGGSQLWSKKKPGHSGGGGGGEQVTTLSRTQSRPGWGKAFASAIFCYGVKAKWCDAGMRLKVVTASQLIHMLGHNSNRHFLVDAGSSYSILPHKSSFPATGLKLFNPAGQPISGWGGRLVQLRFQDQNFSWKFLLAKVAFPIRSCWRPHMTALTRWWTRGQRSSPSKLATGRKL